MAGQNVNDLHAFDTDLLAWTALAPTGRPPPPRIESGFAAVGGMLFLFGGATYGAAFGTFGEHHPTPLRASDSVRSGAIRRQLAQGRLCELRP